MDPSNGEITCLTVGETYSAGRFASLAPRGNPPGDEHDCGPPVRKQTASVIGSPALRPSRSQRLGAGWVRHSAMSRLRRLRLRTRESGSSIFPFAGIADARARGRAPALKSRRWLTRLNVAPDLGQSPLRRGH